MAEVSNDQFAEIRDALFRQNMIHFRDQDISYGVQEAFSRRFGPFAEDALHPVRGRADVRA